MIKSRNVAQNETWRGDRSPVMRMNVKITFISILFLVLLVQSISLAQANSTSESIEQTDKARSEKQVAELLEKLKGQNTQELIENVLKFHHTYPNHPQTVEVAKLLQSISYAEWLILAKEHLLGASPEDSGLVDGWLPIASAWKLRADDAEARDAIRYARESLPRLISAERLVESTIDLCQHEVFDSELTAKLIQDAIGMCEQVSDQERRGIYYADLSGLAAKLGSRELSTSSLNKSLALVERKGVSRNWQTLILRRQLRAAAWTVPPSKTLVLAKDVERLHLSKPMLVADCYVDVAISAANQNDRAQFMSALLFAESKLADSKHRNNFVYPYTTRVGEANLAGGRWRPAVIIANNIPDPRLSASILFRVLTSAPQEVFAIDLPKLFKDYGDQRWAVPAVAGYVEYQLRSGENILDVIEWVQALPLVSQQASGFAGISRVSGSFPAPAEDAVSVLATDIRPDHSDPSALIEAAEQIAEEIEDPLQGAIAWLHIARTWLTLDKTLRYRDAVGKMDDRCFDAWKKVWTERPPVKRSYDGTYYDDDSRSLRTDEVPTVQAIIACQRHLSKFQVDLGDTRGATESFLNLANYAGFIDTSPSYLNWNFLHLEALTNRTYRETGIGPDVFAHNELRQSRDSRPIVAAWMNDAPALIKATAALPQHLKHDKLPHATAELAILYAERGDIANYRNARRAALNQMTENNASQSLKSVLATADAIAGEFTLAEANLVSGPAPWFGDSNRPRSRLAVGYANNREWEKATSHAKKLSENLPSFRGDAWEAISRNRYLDDPASGKALLDWCSELNSLNDQVSVYCGLALAKAAMQQQ